MQANDEEEAERENTGGNEEEEPVEAVPDEPVDEPVDTDEGEPDDGMDWSNTGFGNAPEESKEASPQNPAINESNETPEVTGTGDKENNQEEGKEEDK